MRSHMPAQAYIGQDWFESERDLLLKPLWQFVGLKMMLEQHNSFITRTLCGLPVVVQNFNGELRAFENLCLHRQNPIQTQSHGVRPLVCAYHGWGYNAEGSPANIPFEAELYRFGTAERACLHLRRYALECVGNLVFVNLSENPLPIKNQFGSALLKSLTASSEAFDGEVLMTTYNGRFNWKLAYENLRDGHHPRYLHSRTLFQNVKFQANVDEGGVAALQKLRQEGIRDHAHALALMRTFSGGGRDAPIDNMAHYGWHENVERYRDQDWYYNWLVFPNLHIASGSGGYSFIIEHHIPVGPGRTDFMVYYVTAKKKRPYPASAAVLHGHMMGADRVLREDISVMENIQRTLHPAARPAHLGEYEFLNAGIERWYLDVMEGKIVL